VMLTASPMARVFLRGMEDRLQWFFRARFHDTSFLRHKLPFDVRSLLQASFPPAEDILECGDSGRL
jgi:hypothetical protein